MPYLADVLEFNRGNECPENFLIFAALATAGAVVERKVYTDWNQQRIYTNLYTSLIGPSGNRKTTTKDIFRDIFVEFFPAAPIGPSVTSPQQLMKRLASDECLRAFQDENKIGVEVRPLTFFINELAHFLGVNQIAMIDFLTDIYDSKFIDADYKNTGQDLIPNPYITILGCATGEWVMNKLRGDIISGGFARRNIMIYEERKRCNIPRPFLTPEGAKAKQRVVARLKQVADLVGPMRWEDSAAEFYDSWYMAHNPNIEDRFMEAYFSSKHVIMVKIAMLLSMCDYADMILHLDSMQMALALLQRIEPGMMKLYRGIGRNVLAEPTQRLLAWVESRGGWVPDKEFRLVASRDMRPDEVMGVMRHLESTDQIVKLEQMVNGVKRLVIALKSAVPSLTAPKPVDPSASSPSGTSTSPPPQSS